MKIYILGDHSEWHNGSKAIIQYLRYLIDNRDFELAGTSRHAIQPENMEAWKESDCIIINGEGSMHDNSGEELLDLGHKAKQSGKRVHFINTVWQNMRIPEIEHVKEFDTVIVRELMSYNEIKPLRPDAKISTDLAYDFPITRPVMSGGETAVGSFFHGRAGMVANVDPKIEFPTHCRLTIEDFAEWQDYLNALSTVGFLITGLHHEVIAACKLRIPFIAHRGSSDKVLGIIERAGANIPVSTTSKELLFNMHHPPHPKEYDKLFDFLEEQKPFDLTDLGM